MKICISCNKRRVFAQHRCIYCYRREISIPRQLAKAKVRYNTGKQSKKYIIKNISPKMQLLNLEYNRVKRLKWDELVADKQNYCFFSNRELEPKILPEFHHALGRDGDLLVDMTYCFPCLRKYHREYHDLQRDYINLAREDKLWYSYFLERLRINYPLLYEKEMYLINKANTKYGKFPKT